jgi:aryl-alcohol dehydrogenase-like predicted oxidoreductase
MKSRTIPGTELRASIVGMGCWAMGGKYWGTDITDADSEAAVQEALAQGINFFDTAPLYGEGHADEVLTRALGSRRHDVIIATKVGVRPHGSTGHAESDLSPAHIREDTEASLQRLQLDSIPLLQIHWPCQVGTPIEATMEALMALRDEGKVQHIAACNYDADGLLELKRHGPIATLQTPVSMLRSRLDAPLISACEAPDPREGSSTGIIGYEPLCRGLLTGKHRTLKTFSPEDVRAKDDWFKPPRFFQVQELLAMLDQVQAKVNIPLAPLAIAWTARQPGVVTAIAGAKRPAQILENVRAVEVLASPRLGPVLDEIVRRFPKL